MAWSHAVTGKAVGRSPLQLSAPSALHLSVTHAALTSLSTALAPGLACGPVGGADPAIRCLLSGPRFHVC